MNTPQRIQLSRKKGFNLQAVSMALNGLQAVNCARPSKYGNPFYVNPRQAGRPDFPGACEDRAEAVMMHKSSLLEGGKESNLLDNVRRILRGKNLACWCKPGTPCHCDVLLEIANS